LCSAPISPWGSLAHIATTMSSFDFTVATASSIDLNLLLYSSFQSIIGTPPSEYRKGRPQYLNRLAATDRPDPDAMKATRSPRLTLPSRTAWWKAMGMQPEPV